MLTFLVAAAPARAEPRIMIIGDSLQSGTKLRRLSQQAGVLLQRQANVVVHNFSSPGARMTDVGFFAGMNHAGPAVGLVSGFFGMQGLVVALGTNDWSQDADLAVFHDSYAGFLTGLLPGLPVACLSPPWRQDEASANGNGDTLEDFRDVIRDVCTEAGGTYLDGKDAIPNSLSYFPDGLHPNERGHRAMARFLNAELNQLGWLP